MSYKKCAVPDCESKQQLHRFPSANMRERQLQWLAALGNKDLLLCDPDKLTNHYICRKHFEKKFWLRTKLSATAVPTIHMPGKQILCTYNMLCLIFIIMKIVILTTPIFL